MMGNVKLFTIIFIKETAEEFFTHLIRAGVKRVIDIRLNNVSQLAGFAKRDDLRYFLRTIGGIDYHHRPDLAPTQQILDVFKKSKGSWAVYEKDFLALLSARKVEGEITPELLHDNQHPPSMAWPHSINFERWKTAFKSDLDPGDAMRM